MIRNPVFSEFATSSDELPTANIYASTVASPPPVQQKAKRSVCSRMCGLGVIAAIAVLALVAVSVILIFRPPTSNNSANLESLRQQLQESLRNEQENETVIAAVEAMRQTIQNLQLKLDTSEKRIKEMQTLHVIANETLTRFAVKFQELELKQNTSEERLELQIQHVEDSVQEQQNSSNQTNQHLQQLQSLVQSVENVTAQQEQSITTLRQKLDIVQHNVTSQASSLQAFDEQLNTTNIDLLMGIEQLSDTVNTSIEECQTIRQDTNNSIQELDTKVDNLQAELMSNGTSSPGPLTCEGLPPPDNGGITLTPGPNSLSHGFGSEATYYCDSGYALVGQTTRTCEDTNGGTVTTGTWSGEPPNCQEIYCLELLPPQNGSISTSSQLLLVGTTATYSCDPDYVLVGEATRICEDTNRGTTGTWTGRTPVCQVIVRCPPLTQPTNGAVSISSGTHGVNLGVGAIATYSCDTGYGLIGQAARTCQDANGGTSGTWSGSEPTCQEVISCPSLMNPNNGVITFTPGADNSDIGLSSVATYSCNLGYVLVGQITRECQSLYGGASAGWSGHPPTCQEAVYCPALVAPNNGTVNIISDVNYLSVGSTATYFCDHGYALLGSTTRTCEDPDSDSVGTWTGSMPSCQVILCSQSELTPLENGTIVFGVGSTQLFGVDTTATYSCNPGYILVGEITRTCEDTNGGAQGAWSGSNPSCAIPNLSEIDCQDTTCRYEQLVCPEGEDCSVDCYDSRPYSCFQTEVVCPRGQGCTLNCDDSYACVQANITCPWEAECVVNCPNQYTCLSSIVQSLGHNVILNCEEDYSCQHSTVQCESGNCTINCRDSNSCENADVVCPSNGICIVNCSSDSYYHQSYRACYRSQLTCSEGGNCLFNFNGQYSGYQIGESAEITCQENSTCSINCTGGRIAHSQCQYSRITCPSESGDCTIECSGWYSCRYSTITCGPDGECLTCSGEYSCNAASVIFANSEVATINCTGRYSCVSTILTCPSNSNCTINCDGQYSCDDAEVTCPTGDYSCNIHCTDPLSCSGLSLTNTHNLYLQCCGGLSCAGTSVLPTSTECPYIN